MNKKTITIPAEILKAENVSYNNENSGLEATDIQNAIDELQEDVNSVAGVVSAGLGELASKDSVTESELDSELLEKINASAEGNHSHTNKTVLDNISSTNVSNWDAASTHTTNKNNPHSVTKAQVGLGNVDNTSDVNKPVSTAQQDALDAAFLNANEYTDQKIADLIGGAPTTLDTLKEISDAMVAHKDVTEALNDAIGSKANESEFNSHTTNKNNPHSVTKAQVGLGNVPNVATSDQTPTFTAATTRANIDTGEKLSVIFGKIAKWFSDLKTVAFTGSYGDLSNKPTIPSKTSQLTNDSGYKTTHRSYFGYTDSVDTGDMVVICPEFVLEKGARIAVRFNEGSNGDALSFNVNNTGRKSVYTNDDSDFDYIVNSGEVYEFIYDGGAFYNVKTLDSYYSDYATKLTGVTATSTELNYMKGVTSNVQTQLNRKLSYVAWSNVSEALDSGLSRYYLGTAPTNGLLSGHIALDSFLTILSTTFTVVDAGQPQLDSQAVIYDEETGYLHYMIYGLEQGTKVYLNVFTLDI